MVNVILKNHAFPVEFDFSKTPEQAKATRFFNYCFGSTPTLFAMLMFEKHQLTDSTFTQTKQGITSKESSAAVNASSNNSKHK